MNIIHLPKLERDGDDITISFVELKAPDNRKFRQLRKCARDSVELATSSPVLRINGNILTGHRVGSTPTWAFKVPSRSTVSVLYVGLEYDCGEI